MTEVLTQMIAGGHFVSTPAYIASNASLHEYLVSLAGSVALVDAYRRLSGGSEVAFEGFFPAYRRPSR